jgi:hypothetical protein
MAPEARYDASGSFGLSDPEPAIALCWGGALAASSSAWRTLRSWRARSSEWPRGSQKNFRSTLGQAPMVSHPVIALRNASSAFSPLSGRLALCLFRRSDLAPMVLPPTVRSKRQLKQSPNDCVLRCQWRGGHHEYPEKERITRRVQGCNVPEHAACEGRQAICLICESPWPPARSVGLEDHLCLTERGTPARGILSEWHLGYGHLEVPVREAAQRVKA